MEPIPETVQAIEEFGPYVDGDPDLLHRLGDLAEQTRALVPDCVGLSLAVFEFGITFTMISTAEEIAVLDGLQYLLGGPCVEAVRAERVLGFDHDELEATWQDFARATAARGIASTLTLPILREGAVAGSINLYAASAHAFDGAHEQLADLFGAWAPGAITNADLAFATLQEARQAPRRAQEETAVAAAVALWARRDDIDPEVARERLVEAAILAGVTPGQLAAVLTDLHRPGPDRPEAA